MRGGGRQNSAEILQEGGKGCVVREERERGEEKGKERGCRYCLQARDVSSFI
jgi:hypothetical protein